eukprot:UN32824
MGEETNDWRQGEPIQNLIDPELFVVKFTDQSHYCREKIAMLDKFTAGKSKKNDDQEYYEKDVVPLIKKMRDIYCDKKRFIRDTYRWLPSEFEVCKKNDNTWTAKLISDIHNIPKSEQTAELYTEIEHVFAQMLPLFEKSCRLKESGKLQVVIKAQVYHIEPKSGYGGHWHTEGLTEGVVASGTYYYQVDKGLSAGSLKF